MGRKPNAAKRKEVAQMKPQQEERVELPSQITNPLEGAELRTQNTDQSLERVKLQAKMHANSGNLSSRKKGKHTVSVSVRRSVRLQGAVMHSDNQDIERVIEEIALSESEKEDEQHADEEAEQPKPTMGNKNLEDKVDYLIQLLEDKRNRYSPSEKSCLSHARYKSLYFESQKKMEALINENHQLAMKLENALGKLEAYEKGTRSYSEMLEKLKDVILVSNLTKAAENAVNVSSQARHDGHISPGAGHEPKASSAKRKKLDKLSGKI